MNYNIIEQITEDDFGTRKTSSSLFEAVEFMLKKNGVDIVDPIGNLLWSQVCKRKEGGITNGREEKGDIDDSERICCGRQSKFAVCRAKGSAAYGTLTITNDITRYCKAKVFSQVGKKTECFLRFSTVAGERGAADAERDVRGRVCGHRRWRKMDNFCRTQRPALLEFARVIEAI